MQFQVLYKHQRFDVKKIVDFHTELSDLLEINTSLFLTRKQKKSKQLIRLDVERITRKQLIVKNWLER